MKTLLKEIFYILSKILRKNWVNRRVLPKKSANWMQNQQIDFFENVLDRRVFLFRNNINVALSIETIVGYANLMRKKLGYEEIKPFRKMTKSKRILRNKAFSLFLNLFPELKYDNDWIPPANFTDLTQDEDDDKAASILYGLRIIGGVFRKGNIEPFRYITLYEVIVILNNIYRILSMKSSSPKVFISYSTADEDLVKNFVEEFKFRNLKLFFDRYNLRSGDRLQEEIFRELEKSTYLVIFHSKNSINSEWVQWEIEQFRKIHSGETKNRIHIVKLDLTEVDEKLCGTELLYLNYYLDQRTQEYRLAEMTQSLVDDILYSVREEKII